MDSHEGLVAVRNHIANDGWDVLNYGVGAPCGTPRCILGWCGFVAGSEPALLDTDPTPPLYREILTALWEARNMESPLAERYSLPRKVEWVAFHLDYKGTDGILAWVDRAINATAPDPLAGVVIEEEACAA